MAFDPTSATLDAPAKAPAQVQPAFDPQTAIPANPRASAGQGVSAPSSNWKSRYEGAKASSMAIAAGPISNAVQDPEETTYRALNQSFVQEQLGGENGPRITPQNWDAIKASYASVRFGTSSSKVLTDKELGGLITKNIDGLTHPAGTFWKEINTPFGTLPAAPAVPPGHPALAIAAGVYNGIKPMIDGLNTPLGIATLPLAGELAVLGKTYPLAKAAMLGMGGLFTALMSYGKVKSDAELERVMYDPKSTLQDKITANVASMGQDALVIGSALGLVEGVSSGVLPKVEASKSVPEAVKVLSDAAQEAEDPQQKAVLHNAAEALHKVAPPLEPEIPAPTDEPDTPPSDAVKEPENEGFKGTEKPIQGEGGYVGKDVLPHDTPPEGEAPPPVPAMAKAAEPEPSISEKPPDQIRPSEASMKKVVGMTNAEVDAERARMGLPPAEHGDALSFQQAVDSAAETLSKDPFAGQKLIDELKAKPRAINGEEDALIVHELTRLSNERSAAETELSEARQANDPDRIASANIKVAAAADAYDIATDVDTKVGTINAQGLALRRIRLREDYSLESMERKLKAATKDGKLTPEQQDLVRDIHKRLKEKADAVEKDARKRPDPLTMLKGRLEKRIAELDEQIKTKVKNVNSRKPIPLDDEARKLIETRDALRKQHNEIFAEKGLTDEQRMKAAVAAKNRQVAEIERQIRTQEVFHAERKATSTGPELDAIQAKIDALKEQREYVRETIQTPDDPPTELEKRSDALDAQIKKIEEQLKNEEVFSKGKKPEGEMTPELQAKKDQLDALKEQREYVRQRIQPRKEPKTKQEIIAARYKKAAADIREKLSKGDLSKKGNPPPIELDPETEKAKAEYESVKREFDEAVIKARLEQRTLPEKAMDTLVKWRRGFVLSGPVTVAKLTAAAGWRLAVTPLREAVGGVLGKLPLIREVAKGAPMEGGFNSRALAKAYTEAFTTGIRDSLHTLKTGGSNLDLLYGKGKDSGVGESDVLGRSVIDFFGSLHGALKAPVKRFAFTLSFEKQMAWNIEHGVDVSNPLVQVKASMHAYKDAQAMIFLQDNKINDIWKGALQAADRPEKATGKIPISGKVAGTVMRTAVPVTKVPTNVVGEAIEHAVGLGTGSWNLAQAFRAGFDTLSPDQADTIMRQMKNGVLGAGGLALLLGYFTAKNSPIKFGGFYQPGKKQQPGDVPYGAARVDAPFFADNLPMYGQNMPLYGQNIPSYLLDHPLIQTLQLGQTVYNVANSKIRKKDQGPAGLATGVWAGLLGLVDETPFGREAGDAGHILTGNPGERQYYEGEFMKGLVIPQGINYLAQKMDSKDGKPVQRQTTTIPEHIQSGIPYLREQLPERNINTTKRKKP